MSQSTACLACGSTVHYPLYRPEHQPLAALNLPRSKRGALNVRRFPMDFHACAYCGHIYNVAFSYSDVPYEDDSNLMYNRGSVWQLYLQELIDRLHRKYDFDGQTVVEIGCGDGHFLKSLREKIPSLRCIGFEPGIDPLSMKGAPIRVVNDYFTAERDIVQLKPDLVVCRHVLEHLPAPREFVMEIAYWCNMHEIYPFFLIEVPCIDNAIDQVRVNDYLYEHVSNFTDMSLRAMFERAGYDILEYGKKYRDEVLVLLAKPRKLPQLQIIKKTSQAYAEAIEQQRHSVREMLEAWRKAGRRIAFWGGTGKGAAFLNSFNLGCEDYPVVIDSDELKIGRFVPGTGQELRAPDYLRAEPVDIIVITTQWRAPDICDEIRRRGIACEAIYVVRNKALEKLAQ